jgi:PAS domain S-box-containing protein
MWNRERFCRRDSARQAEALVLYEYLHFATMRGRCWAHRVGRLLICCFLWHATTTAGAEESRRVLVLYEQGRSTAAVAVADREIREVLEKQTTYHVDLYVEYMETNLFVDPASQQKIREWYLQKYRDHQPDVIIAGGSTPIRFMIDAHKDNFPGVPIVICGTTENWTDRSELDSLFTGTWMDLDPAKTLDVALKLKPDTKQVVIVNGASPFDMSLEAVLQKTLHPYESKLNFTYLTGLPMSSLLPRIRQTPDHTIILFGTINQDGAGDRFIPASQSLPMVVGAANAPVFTMLDTLVGQGSVGGNVISYAAQGRIAAEDVLKILGGVKPQDIPIVKGPNEYLFDWRAVRRWNLKKNSLPTESTVLNRQPTLIEEYGRYVFGGLVLLFGQLLLILQLLRQRAKERSIRRDLYESEIRLREAQGIAQCGSWVWDIARDKMYWSDEMYRILGLVPHSVAPEGRLIHPGDDRYYVAKMREASDTHRPYTAEHRVVRPNGEERFVLESGQPKYDSQQKPVSMIGTMLDVTEQRRAEQVLRESEERFRTMADGAPIMMWMAGIDKLCTDFNRGWLEYTGRSIEEELGNGWADGVHPDDLQRCLKIYTESFEARMPFTMEYRLRRYDGQYHWISDAGSPRFLADGTFAGYIGSCLDIHDRKAVELARVDLARRLMGAQEAERSRIARELHDGIGQEIALLSIQMQRASVTIWPNAGPKKNGMQEFSDKLAAIGVHVGRLSHQLHSSELEYLGLTVAITKLCREFSEESPIKVTCTCSRIPSKLANDVALTFFRIVQESLHNVAKHSEAKTVHVEVVGMAEELSLSVRDDGTGFDVQESQTAAGLGLISMRERMQVIGGKFEIESSSGAGTSIRARVPLTTYAPETSHI